MPVCNLCHKAVCAQSTCHTSYQWIIISSSSAKLLPGQKFCNTIKARLPAERQYCFWEVNICEQGFFFTDNANVPPVFNEILCLRSCNFKWHMLQTKDFGQTGIFYTIWSLLLGRILADIQDQLVAFHRYAIARDRVSNSKKSSSENLAVMQFWPCNILPD